jgi:hypothetical protein
MPIRGAVADLSAILKAQSVSQLIVASRYIKSDRLHQALSVCQERRIPVVRAHLKLEPIILKPSALSILNFRVEGLEFGACVIDFELPIDPALLLITGRRPRGGFRRQLLGVAKPAVV